MSQPPAPLRASRRRIAPVMALVLFGWSAVQLFGQTRPAAPPIPPVHGAITTQEGAVYLPGVVVTLLDPASGQAVAETTSDATGQFAFGDVAPGSYVVRAVLDGFNEGRKSILVASGRSADGSLDLGIAKLSENVKVEAAAQALLDAAPALKTGNGDALEIGPIKGDNFQALLPTLPGIVRGLDGHVSIKGGTPSQSSVQLNAANVTDPSTGELGFDLPNDAVESVDVQANPYAAEFGRFSSGVTTLNTTRGGPRWSFTPNGFIPRLYRAQGDWWKIMGIRSFRPRFALGGPIVPDKIFLFENVLYRYFRTPIPGLPDSDSPVFSEVKTFTRLDDNVSPGHLMTVTAATFPQQVDYANLNTFNRKDVSTNFRQGGANVVFADRATLGGTTLLESTVAVKQYNVRIGGQGTAPMQVTPDDNEGNYFNRQSRRSRTYQWIESLTMTRTGPTGEHLLKFGADVLQVSYDGTSASSPIEVRREDGSLLQRITFGAPTTQHVTSTEGALLAQDHWRLGDRVLLELGGRVDHDGVLGRTNVTPRAGGAVSLLPDGKTILRGGIGLFYDRTPLNVGAFQSFEPRTLTSYAEDGVTPLGPSITLPHTTGELRTPYSRTWNVELDHRLDDHWSFKVNHLERDGRDEFVVDPMTDGAVPTLRLSSDGRSKYRETEFSVRFADSDRVETTVSYVRSHAMADLNSYDLFFGNARAPIIRPNEYGLSPVDTPNRLIVRGSYQLPLKVHVDPMLEVHTGFPYSTIAEDQSFVGPENGAGRYRRFLSFDFSASRPVRIWKYRATFGVRMFNAQNRFNPRDANRNLASPAFGTFYNMVPRDFQTFIQLGMP